MTQQTMAILWMVAALFGLGLFTVFALLAVRRTAVVRSPAGSNENSVASKNIENEEETP